MRKIVRLTLLLLSPFLLIYIGAFAGVVPEHQTGLYNILLLAIKIYILAGFAALCRVLQLAFNFNNCKQAANELRQEVKDAKEDLKRKGFDFK